MDYKINWFTNLFFMNPTLLMNVKGFSRVSFHEKEYDTEQSYTRPVIREPSQRSLYFMSLLGTEIFFL